MGHTTVRAHTRRGHPVRAHGRRTNGRDVADVLQRDLDRLYDRLDRELEDRAAPMPTPDSACEHPGWYAVPRVCICDEPCDCKSQVLAYACTDCAASRSA